MRREFLLCAAFAVLASPAVRAQDQPDAQPQLQLIELDHWDVSPPLRDMKVIPPSYEWLEQNPTPEPKRWRGPSDPKASGPDAALQRRVSPLVNAVPGLSFDGVGIGLGSYSPNVAPPDTTGDIGTTQYVQWVNLAFAVFNKTTGALVFGPANGNTLWQGFGGRCETDNSGDPIVMFDQVAQRWVMTQFAVSASPYMQCIAVSTSADATGTYRRFSYAYGTDFNDYPKLGVWPDAYYVTYNIFANASSFAGSKVCAFDRNAMLSVSGVPAAQQCFQTSTTYGGLLPADWDGQNAPPAGAPNPVMAFDDIGNDGLNLWKFHVDFATPGNATFTGPAKINVTPFTPICASASRGACVPQAGTSTVLESLADRLMNRLQYRNFGDHESLVVTHAVVATGSAGGIRWYEIRDPNGTPTVFQQSTYSPDSTWRWMSSMAMDKLGNMMTGYSASSSSVIPSVRVSGRLVSDPLNTLQAETPTFAGTGSQTGTLQRWGDYSNMTVDPVDDCTFWFTTEYIKASGSFNWSTRIASYQFPTCTGSAALAAADASIAEGNSGSSNVTVTVALNPTSAQAVTVNYATADGTATAGVDYVAQSGTLTFAPNATQQTISIQVNGDTLPEADETFFVNLTNPTGGAVFLDNQAIVTITNDDAQPSMTVGDATVVEGDSGTRNLQFNVALSGASGQAVTVNYATADGTANADRARVANTASITIPDSGASTPYPAIINVPAGAINGSVVKVTATIDGLSHTYPSDIDLLLVGPTGQSVILMSDAGTGTDVSNITLVFDDSGPPLTTAAIVAGTYHPTDLTSGDTWPAPAPAGPYGTAMAGFNGLSPTGDWKLYLVDDAGQDSGSIARGFAIDFQTTGGDYRFTSGTLTFAPGVTSQPVTVQVVGDLLPEPNETFSLNFSGAVAANLTDNQAIGTIRDDDPKAADFGGDGKSDVVVFRSGAWLFYDYATGNALPGVFTGQPQAPCTPAPGDFNGDGKVEFSELCSDGKWYFFDANGAGVNTVPITGWTAADVPVPADYNGDGKDDIVVYRAGSWITFDYITTLQTGAVFTGAPGASPVPYAADFDGDGKADLSIYSGGAWHFYNPDGSYKQGIWTGSIAGDVPVAGDYDGDGADDVVVWRAGAWLWFDYATGSYNAAKSVFTGSPSHFTGGTSLPAPIDVNGDGILDRAVWSGGPWHFYQANGSYDRGVWCGAVAGDRAISRRPQ
jgi:subtilisin-like proprotein convertase family protein